MMPILMVVCAALVDAERRVLLQRRAPGRAMAGLWEFPGGKVEAGELPQAALSRRMGGEGGIEVGKAGAPPARCAGSGRPRCTRSPCRRPTPRSSTFSRLCWKLGDERRVASHPGDDRRFALPVHRR